MRSFSTRRWSNAFICLILAMILIALDRLGDLTLHRMSAFTGWGLLAIVIFLTMYNLRKKLPALPIGSSSTWLQLHIYTGLISSVVFLLHIGWRVPNGVFESILATLYVSVFISGIVGLWMSRTFARRLATHGEEVIFERIPRVRHRIRQDVEKLMLDYLAETESTALLEFYNQRLRHYFEKPMYLIPILFQSNRNRKALLGEIDAHCRYLNDDEQLILHKIADWIRAKHDLDYQYSHQAALKYWLFTHVPLTYAMLVFATFHIVLVHAFSGGIR